MNPCTLSHRFILSPAGWFPLGAPLADPVDDVLAAHDVIEHGVARCEQPLVDELLAFGAFGFIRGYDPRFETLAMDLALTFKDVLQGRLALPAVWDFPPTAQPLARLPLEVETLHCQNLFDCLQNLQDALCQDGYWSWIQVQLTQGQQQFAQALLKPRFKAHCLQALRVGYLRAQEVFQKEQFAALAFERVRHLAGVMLRTTRQAPVGTVMELGYELLSARAYVVLGVSDAEVSGCTPWDSTLLEGSLTINGSMTV